MSFAFVPPPHAERVPPIIGQQAVAGRLATKSLGVDASIVSQLSTNRQDVSGVSTRPCRARRPLGEEGSERQRGHHDSGGDPHPDVSLVLPFSAQHEEN